MEEKRYVQIGVALEEDTIHIPDLTFVPVGAVEQTDDGGDSGDLVGVGLDADAGLVGVGEKVVDDLGRGQHIARSNTQYTPRTCWALWGSRLR